MRWLKDDAIGPATSTAIDNPAPSGYLSRSLPTPFPAMCRNIRTLFNFDPPATDAEVRAAALQFVRKVSGFVAPSAANEAAFAAAVDEIAAVSRRLIDSLETRAPAKNRQEEAAKARARAVQRYAPRTEEPAQ